jgi:hypothetical protein
MESKGTHDSVGGSTNTFVIQSIFPFQDEHANIVATWTNDKLMT